MCDIHGDNYSLHRLCNKLLIEINVKKTAVYKHTVNGDGSKTAKIIKRQC